MLFLPSFGELKLACNFPLALTSLPKTPQSALDSEIISVKQAREGKVQNGYGGKKTFRIATVYVTSIMEYILSQG